MYLRKIQLIAGTTYSVSLPKEWILANKLKEKNTISLEVRDDQTIVVSPKVIDTPLKKKEFEINADLYEKEIDQILFSLFYTGFEDISITSKKGISDKVKSRIKRAINAMSGSEIIYEDDTSMKIKVLLNIDNLDLGPLFYRLYLILNSSATSLKKGIDKELIEMNEDEVDRLFHLLVKQISLVNLYPERIRKSGFDNTFSILPHFLIAKRLEHLGDSIYRMVDKTHETSLAKEKEQIGFILDKVLEGTKRCIGLLNGKKQDTSKQMFKKTDQEKIDALSKMIDAIHNETARHYLHESLRCMIHIEEEMVNIAFYSGLAG